MAIFEAVHQLVEVDGHNTDSIHQITVGMSEMCLDLRSLAEQIASFQQGS